MKQLTIYADDLLRLLGPTDESDDTPITATTSCTARLYDDREDTLVLARSEALAVEAEASDTQITLDDTSRFNATEAVELELDDGGYHVTTISSIDSATLLTLGSAVPSSASVGKLLRRLTHPIGATVIEVGNGHLYEVNDAVEVRQDDGTRHETTISARAKETITLAAGITVACSHGRRVSRKLGADLAMTIYNGAAAAARTKDWGYQVTLPDDHPGIENGQKVRIEFELIADSGFILRENLRALVVGDG